MYQRVRQAALKFSLILTLLLTGSLPGFAEVDRSLAPIFVNQEDPSVFYLIGDIDGRTAFNFKRAVSQYGPPSELVLKSGGGLVHEGLLLALEVKDLRVKTVVHDYCMSACFYVFMAGEYREILGELGVHQISSDSGDLGSGQLAIADIIDVLNKLEVDREILVLMLQTPSEEMHVFTSDEIRHYQLATLGENSRINSVETSDPQQILVNVESAIAFVTAHNLLWSQTNAVALADLPNTYADQVSFYNNTWTREQVMQDKIAFANRWPVRDYHFRPSVSVSFCGSSGICKVVGEVDWYAHSPGRSATSRGTSEVEILLESNGDVFRIISEDGRVTSRR